MHGLKSAILAIFQKLADWLDWPCPVSAALNFRLVFCHSDPDPSSVTYHLIVKSMFWLDSIAHYTEVGCVIFSFSGFTIATVKTFQDKKSPFLKIRTF